MSRRLGFGSCMAGAWKFSGWKLFTENKLCTQQSYVKYAQLNIPATLELLPRGFFVGAGGDNEPSCCLVAKALGARRKENGKELIWFTTTRRYRGESEFTQFRRCEHQLHRCSLKSGFLEP